MDNLANLGLIGLFIGCFLAATGIPFSSDALYVAMLAVTDYPVKCLVVATLGNWLGGVFSYWICRLCKWEWIEKLFKVKHETLDKQHKYVEKYGVWLAFISWVPFVGDVFVIALGFYKSPPVLTLLFMFIGKAGRFVLWSMLLGAI